MWGVGSQTGDGSRTPCCGSVESSLTTGPPRKSPDLLKRKTKVLYCSVFCFVFALEDVQLVAN